MFWSKIWLFVLAAAAAVALTIALLLPRPAQRARVQEERQKLVVACEVVKVQMRDAAYSLTGVVEAFARKPPIVAALDQATSAGAIDEARNRVGVDLAKETLDEVEGARPDFAILIDGKGRVLARSGIDQTEYGDTMAGRFLVDDALTGYVRDDLWYVGNRLYRVAASPVIQRDQKTEYVGAVVLGAAVTKEFAEEMMRPLGAKISFYTRGQAVAASTPIVLDRELIEGAAASGASGDDLSEDCQTNQPFAARSGKDEYTAILARLPGEARFDDAYYTVFVERAKVAGLAATLDAVRKNDLSFANFPWLVVGLGFLVALGGGLAFMWLEHDRPVRRLSADAVALAKGKNERLPEDQHGGRMGSIARSVNIHVDKLAREGRAARRDLDQLLGPGDGSLGSLDLATPLPASRPGGDAPPPRAEFRFSDPLPAPELDLSPTPSARPTPAARPTPPPRPAVPPPRPTPPPRPAMPPPRPTPPPHKAIEDDLLAEETTGVRDVDESSLPGDDDTYFRAVFDEFVELKKRCGESTSGLSYAKFADKLRRNRSGLMARPSVVGVKFSVYVKEGKAALKATPVKNG